MGDRPEVGGASRKRGAPSAGDGSYDSRKKNSHTRRQTRSLVMGDHWHWLRLGAVSCQRQLTLLQLTGTRVYALRLAACLRTNSAAVTVAALFLALEAMPGRGASRYAK
jgi:hypothetical protein